MYHGPFIHIESFLQNASHIIELYSLSQSHSQKINKYMLRIKLKIVFEPFGFPILIHINRHIIGGKKTA